MNNFEGYDQAALLVFSGLVAEVNAFDVPSGSSPLATDCDYTVTSVKTRDGLSNVYTFEGASQIGNFVVTAGSGGGGGPVNPIFNTNAYGFYNDTNTILLGANGTDGSFFSAGTITSGNLMMLSFYRVSGSTITPSTSVTDANGNTWTNIFVENYLISALSTYYNFEVWVAVANATITTSLSSTFAITVNGGSPTVRGGSFESWTGVGPFISATSPQTSSSNLTLSGLTTTGTALVIAVAGGPNVTTATNDFGLVVGTFATQPLVYNWISGGSLAAPAGTYSTVVTNSTYEASGCLASFGATPGSEVPIPAGSTQLIANALGAGLTVPLTSTVLGIQVTIVGSETAPGLVVTVAAVGDGSTTPKTTTLPTSSGPITLGGSNDLWGGTWTPAELNSPAFGFSVTGFNSTSAPINATVLSAQVMVWYSDPSVGFFDHVASFEQTDGGVLTLALDDTGVWWQEDVINNPYVLEPFYTAIEPDTFGNGITYDDRFFIALSDLQYGTDMPRQYTGQWVDRVSQIGPAAPPAITFASNEYPIVNITQASAFNGGTDLAAVLWSSGPTLTTAGNTLTFYFNVGNTDTNSIVVGSSVILSGFSGPLAGINSTGGPPVIPSIVTSVGTAIGEGGLEYPIFTIAAPSVNYTDVQRRLGQQGYFGTITLTLATLTTSVPVPNLQVGSQFTVSGSSVPTWDGTWTALFTPNASQLSITSTALASNVATYTYTIITGSPPSVGQQVTVTGTANGDGIFNVSNAVITATAPSQFSLTIISPDISSSGETGTAIVNGTIFQFDPGQVISTGTGGELSIAGGLGAGSRGCVVMFLTRNGLLTAPSPPVIFTLNNAASSIIASQIPIGPDNVIARVLAFTGAGGATQLGGGGFYFWIPTPVSVIDNGQVVTYTATIINDNTSTTAQFSFTDAVLLAADSITTQGSNNFNQIELGSCIGLTAYSQRIFALGENNKINNLLNYSFDGGIGSIIPPPGDPSSQIVTYPLGWTVNPLFGTGASVVTSPLFGNAYQIQNTTGSTQATWGMITQNAYEDSNQVPIIFSQTPYSIRVTAASTPAASGNLVVDLAGNIPGPGGVARPFVYGSFSIPLSALTPNMQIYTGTLLTSQFNTVPSDLQIRIYATSIPTATTITIDRIEPFPTMQPVLTTQLRGSYFDNFEAFDQITGNLGVGAQNQQPARATFSLFDNFYIVKTRSLVSTTDNGTTEPSGWTVREVSNKVGTPSIYGVDVGEGWALIAGQSGLYLFEGGEPVKISPELDGDDPGGPTPGVWQSISWTYGNTLWVRNDTEHRRILIGVPMPTPNRWMPDFPINTNPTQPNVVLMCNYRELMTSGALANEGPIRLTYMGDLKTYALGRKWAAWSIEACYADFITRPDTTQKIFYCSDDQTGKIYQQLAGNYADDGQSMFFHYITYPFPKTIEAQQAQLGLGMLEAGYMTMLIRGQGNLNVTIYPNSLDSPDADALYPETLDPIAPWGDTEIPLNEVGNRFFVGIDLLNQPGAYCELSRVVMGLKESPWSVVRGSND